jgi:hypothetical protein
MDRIRRVALGAPSSLSLLMGPIQSLEAAPAAPAVQSYSIDHFATPEIEQAEFKMRIAEAFGWPSADV